MRPNHCPRFFPPVKWHPGLTYTSPNVHRMKQNQPAGGTWSNHTDKHRVLLEHKSNPLNVRLSCAVTLCCWIQTRKVTLCKLRHFTPCWTQNGAGWGGARTGEQWFNLTGINILRLVRRQSCTGLRATVTAYNSKQVGGRLRLYTQPEQSREQEKKHGYVLRRKPKKRNVTCELQLK